VAITKSGYPHAHKGTNGRHCAGVESKVLAGEVDESIVLGVTNKTIVELPRTPYGPQGYCLVCGKRSDVDIDTGKITRHGHCPGNNTPAHPYSPSDDEFTPPEIYEPVLRALGRKSFAFDPCSHPKALVPAETKLYYEHQGLSFDWGGEEVGWGQPPYSRPGEWIRRFAEHPGGMVCLLNGDFSTSIYEETIWPQALFTILLYKRVKHISPHRTGERVQAKRPSSIVAFDPEGAIDWVPEGVAELESMGRVVS
jgi:hypothetical protein